MSQFEQLSKFTSIVADTGEIEQIKKYKPEDATTNPSLILKASTLKEYQHFLDDCVDYSLKNGDGQVSVALDRLLVNFGTEITKIVPGVVSTEVDARLSFNTDATIKQAKRIIDLYKENGVDKDRVLIKIASTWEGIQAAEVLERDYGIHCNMTLLFSLAQAAAAAEVGAYLISPFVGRITDWYKKSLNVDGFLPEEDPGVKNVTEIYTYYKSLGYKTIVMGASFRNIGQVQRLSGCDKLTLSPEILEELSNNNEPLEICLKPEVKDDNVSKMEITESQFRWLMNEDPMATEKLAEGIRKFAADTVKLEVLLQERLDAAKN